MAKMLALFQHRLPILAFVPQAALKYLDTMQQVGLSLALVVMIQCSPWTVLQLNSLTWSS
jgi:hypothetical protein